MLADRAAEPDERSQAAAGQAGQQPVDQLLDGRDREPRREDRADELLHRPCAGDLAASGVEDSERGGLAVGEVLGVLQQRPARVLEGLGGLALAR